MLRLTQTGVHWRCPPIPVPPPLHSWVRVFCWGVFQVRRECEKLRLAWAKDLSLYVQSSPLNHPVEECCLGHHAHPRNFRVLVLEEGETQNSMHPRVPVSELSNSGQFSVDKICSKLQGEARSQYVFPSVSPASYHSAQLASGPPAFHSCLSPRSHGRPS